MEGMWSLDLGLFRLEWARFLAHVPGAMLGHLVEKISQRFNPSRKNPSIAPGTWARNRAHSKRNRPNFSDHIPSIVSCLAPAASPAQESVRWGGREPARQVLISTARRYPPLHLFAQTRTQVETSSPLAPTPNRMYRHDSRSKATKALPFRTKG